MTALLLCLILAIPYLIPSLIANARRHRNANSIFVFNIFFGWSILGWVVALMWSVSGNVEPKKIVARVALPPPLPEPVAIGQLIKSGERFDFATQKWVPMYTTKMQVNHSSS